MSGATSPLAKPRDAHRLLWISRMAFAVTFVLAMITPQWESGTFAHIPILRVRSSAGTLQIGILALLPALSAATWVAALALERPQRPWHWGPAHIALPVYGFSALILIRIWPVHIPHTAVITMVSVAMFLGTYLYVLYGWHERWSLWVLAVFLALQGGIAILQFLRQGSVGLFWMGEAWLDPNGQGVSVIQAAGRRWVRAYGMTFHPNALGGYLSMSILICLGAVRSASARARHWLWGALAIGGMGLCFTFSRSAWLGTIAGLIYMAGVTRPWRGLGWQDPRTKKTLIISATILIAGVLAFGVTYGELLITRFFRLNDPLEARSIRDRLIDIRQAWGLIRTVPLKGAGSGYYVAALWAGVGDDRPPGFRAVHNVPLLAAAELGIGGAVLWLWMLLASPVALLRQLQHSVPGRESVNSVRGHVGWAAAFVSALVVSLFDNYLYIPSTWWPALYLALMAGEWARGQVVPTHRGQRP